MNDSDRFVNPGIIAGINLVEFVVVVQCFALLSTTSATNLLADVNDSTTLLTLLTTWGLGTLLCALGMTKYADAKGQLMKLRALWYALSLVPLLGPVFLVLGIFFTSEDISGVMLLTYLAGSLLMIAAIMIPYFL